MKWLKITIQTTVAATDIIIANLCEVGLTGAQIEDNVPLSATEKERMFIDFIPGPSPDGDGARLSFYGEMNDDGMTAIAGMRMDAASLIDLVAGRLKEIGAFVDLGDGDITLAETADDDWVNNWKEHFRSFIIDDILVMPSWEEESGTQGDSVRHILRIDPGMAFGTGMHETTQLCIRALRAHLPPAAALLDIGCGSGILSVLGIMFGASRAVAVDLDPLVRAEAEKNRQMNGIAPGRMAVMIGDIINDGDFRRAVAAMGHDAIVANIVTEVLVSLIPAVCSCLRQGGIFIVSGIVCPREESLCPGDVPVKEAQVTAAIEAVGMEVVSVTRQGEWACMVFTQGER